MRERVETEENARIAAQVEILGREGLAKLAAELQAAKADNDRPFPTEVLTDFPIPSVSTISWIPVTSVQNRGVGKTVAVPSALQLEQHITADASKVPVFVHFNNVKANFVTLSAYISLQNLPDDLRPFLTVYLNCFHSIPMTLSYGEKLTHEEVVDRLETLTVEYDAGLGVNGVFSQMLLTFMKVERSSYEIAVTWLKELLFSSHFDVER